MGCEMGSSDLWLGERRLFVSTVTALSWLIDQKAQLGSVLRQVPVQSGALIPV